MSKKLVLYCLIVLVLAGFTGCTKETTESADAKKNSQNTQALIRRPRANLNAADARIFETNVSEELVLELTPKLRVLSKHLRGEPTDLGELFADDVSYLGIDTFDLKTAVTEYAAASSRLGMHLSWPLCSDRTSISAGKFWLPLLQEYQFDDVQFGVVRARADASADILHMESVFEGRFHDAEQHLFGVKAKQSIDWIPAATGGWKIGSWKQTEFEIVAAKRALFENVTEQLVADKPTFTDLTRSRHEERILELFETGSGIIDADSRHPFFSDWESTFQYPAASVNDFDGDGWEDLFVTDRWGKSILLKNQSGKSFEDVTESSGLIVDEFGNGAVFADFDNDGDADVLVARTVEPCLFFRNEGGKFIPDAQVNENLSDIKFVVCLSVADVNRDGLLDVYLSTYCYTGGDAAKWIDEVVPIEDRLPMQMSVGRQHPYLDRGGPPNVLLLNRGGNLERAPIDKTLKQFRNSFQSAWFDYDEDGDVDLYICNDYSPDVFLRNDTVRGSFDPKFTDVTAAAFPEKLMGFGMGVSLGDYNEDGRLDLYVSNMYSKAGLRIVEQIGGEVDPRILVSAKGNFLYENLGRDFRQVAGLDELSQHVSKVGWSFGGQLADLDNDSLLDLYVPSGLYSVPNEIDSQVDL